MGDGFDVEIAQLDLAGQLFDRQKSHMTAIGSYVSGNCAASGAFRGLMVVMKGHYDECLSSATTGMAHGATIAAHCSTTVAANKATYLARDRAAYDAFAAKEKAAGRSVAPYKPPTGGGPLGPAVHSDTPTGGPGGSDSTSPLGALGTLGGLGGRFATKTLSGDPMHPWNREPYDPSKDGFDPGKWAGNKVQEGVNNARAQYDDYRGAQDGMTGDQRAAARYQQMQQDYNDAYDRGTAAAAGRVPDGTAYSGSADADGNITSDKRPGSAWSQDTGDVVKTGKDAGEAYGAAKDTYDNAKDVYDNAKDLGDAVSDHQHVEQVANGASNTSSYDWATGKGGTW